MCKADYSGQQLSKLRAHYRRKIAALDDEGEERRDPQALLRSFDTMEESWETYREATCELKCYGTVEWMPVDDMCYLECRASGDEIRMEQLIELMGYIGTWPNPLAERTEILRTRRFDITLTAGCELGFFDCEEMRYRGMNRETEESLELRGRRLRDCTWDEPCVWRGYEFEYEGVVYRIDESGTLDVVRSKDGTVLVSEQGAWETVR